MWQWESGYVGFDQVLRSTSTDKDSTTFHRELYVNVVESLSEVINYKQSPIRRHRSIFYPTYVANSEIVSRQSKGFTRPVDAKRVIHADGWHKAGFLGQGCHGGYFQEELMRILREVPPNTELENMRVLVVHVAASVREHHDDRRVMFKSEPQFNLRSATSVRRLFLMSNFTMEVHRLERQNV